jgi:hypothetical protein
VHSLFRSVTNAYSKRRFNRQAAVNMICRVMEEDVVVAVVEQGGKKLKED